MTQMPMAHTITVTAMVRVEGQLTEVTLYEGGDIDEAIAVSDEARPLVAAGALEAVEVFEHRRRHIDGVCRCA